MKNKLAMPKKLAASKTIFLILLALLIAFPASTPITGTTFATAADIPSNWEEYPVYDVGIPEQENFYGPWPEEDKNQNGELSFAFDDIWLTLDFIFHDFSPGEFAAIKIEMKADTPGANPWFTVGQNAQGGNNAKYLSEWKTISGKSVALTTHYQSFILPLNSNGTHWIGKPSIAFNAGAGVSNFKGNIYIGKIVLYREATLREPVGTDLIISKIHLNPSDPKPGETATASVFVQNTGADVDVTKLRSWLTVNGVNGAFTNEFTGTLKRNQIIELTLPDVYIAEGKNVLEASLNGCEHIEEENFDNNSLKAEYNTRGAHMPYVDYEGEDGNTNANVLTAAPYRRGDLASEARMGKTVNLKLVGHYVQWAAAEDANAINLRTSIPEGADNDVSLYVNGEFRQKLTLNGIRLQGERSEGTTLLYRDTSILLDQPISRGDCVRLQKDDDDANYIAVDFIELENAVKNEKPDNLVSISDFGAVSGNNNVDNIPAIYDAIKYAINNDFAGIWFPEGDWGIAKDISLRFDQNYRAFNLPAGFEFAGAGMWYTRIYRIYNDDPNPYGWGNFGFKGYGRTAHFHDFKIDGLIGNQCSDASGFSRISGQDTIIENIWIEGTGTGIWSGSEGALTDFPDLTPEQARSDGLLIQNLRIRNTTADGINLCNGLTNVTVYNVACRSNGDDGFAMWSYVPGGVNNPFGNEGNIMRNCTAELGTLAYGFSLYGGKDNFYIDCIARDHLFSGSGLNCNDVRFQGTDPNPMTGISGYERVTVERCGWASEGWWPSIMVDGSHGQGIGNLLYKDIVVEDADYAAILISGNISNTVFENLTVKGYTLFEFPPARAGAIIYNNSAGAITFNGARFLNPSGLSRTVENVQGVISGLKIVRNNWTTGIISETREPEPCTHDIPLPIPIDLSVSAVKPTASSIVDGDTTKYTCTVRNNDKTNDTTGTVRVDFYRDNKLFDTIYISKSIEADGYVTVTTSKQYTEWIGSHTIRAIINSDKVILDNNTANDTLKSRFIVADD